MTRIFIELSNFRKAWIDIGLTDDNLHDFQVYLLKNLNVGDVIPGTGGLRKIRWAAKGKGKRSGARILYFDLESKSKTYLLTVYSKNDQENISEIEKKEIKKLIEILKRTAT